jgi:phosphoenolpyruvate carboxykinase (GTP)
MVDNTRKILEMHLNAANLDKLNRIDNPAVHDFIAKYISLCQPSSVFVATDASADWNYIRQAALRNHEEAPLKMKNHTIHFDAYEDQGRDKKNTLYLVDDMTYLDEELNFRERKSGLVEVERIMKGIMKDREMFVCFFSLGPVDSQFAIPSLQITDSAYVAHSEKVLYRTGFKLFEKLDAKTKFFRIVHSQGQTVEAGLGLRVSKDIKDRRVYIDLVDETVYSVNTQYGGNTIGLKKLSMRLAIQRACKEDWLTEHMFIMSVGDRNGRRVYLTGAFPSMCGKTTTSMVPGETILGDDIAYLRVADDCVRAVNVERGMFGIIHGINKMDDELQWKALKDPNTEVIFSNILVKPDGDAYWDGMDGNPPQKGTNHSGQWQKGNKDAAGKEIPISHKNARFSISLSSLDNIDQRLEDPMGVKVRGIIYGGRDSFTWVPVEEAFDWAHGIITKGASLESETTAATLGQAGVMAFNPMSNIDFISVPIGTYVQKNLEFGTKCKNPPRIFSVNYFLKDQATGKYLNAKTDKGIWLKWIANRVHDDAEAIKTPTGMIPTYEDLRDLFKETGKDYSREDYIRQFSFSCKYHLEKIDRLVAKYRTVKNTPPILYDIMEQQKARIENLRKQKGDVVSPFDL